MSEGGVAALAQQDDVDDPRRPLKQLMRGLRTSPKGLSEREAARRLVADGPNELVRRGSKNWPRELARQFTHPLALLLLAATALSLANRSVLLACAIAAVIVLNAVLAFVQEMQAENAVEALAAFLPERARVLRDGKRTEIEARLLVPGDVLLVEEGDRICADARLIDGAVEVDLSTLTGESLPALRSAEFVNESGALLEARDLLFSGTTCTGGEARAVVTRTGMRTELGRIAALSEQTTQEPSPLERQVKRVAWLIGSVALIAALAFLPLGAVAGLSLGAALSFSIGLLVANVPEGLLPTITLALAVGVRDLAKRGAVVKRPPFGIPGGLVAVGNSARSARDLAHVGATVWGVGEGAECLEGEGLVLNIAQADDVGLAETVVIVLLQLKEASSPTGRQNRKRSSCPNQASLGSICQASATGVWSSTPETCQWPWAESNTATGLPVVSKLTVLGLCASGVVGGHHRLGAPGIGQFAKSLSRHLADTRPIR